VAKEKLIEQVVRKIENDSSTDRWSFETDNVELIWQEAMSCFIYLNFNNNIFDEAYDGNLTDIVHHLSDKTLQEFLYEEE
jgi:hypothetical protein